MKIKTLIAAALVYGTSAAAHELTPTYVEFTPSYITGVYSTKIKMWNRREDVNYYEISVFDEEWNPVDFAAVDRLIKLDYLDKKVVEIYIRKYDVDKAHYICTKSKILKSDAITSSITSRICSKVR